VSWLHCVQLYNCLMFSCWLAGCWNHWRGRVGRLRGGGGVVVGWEWGGGGVGVRSSQQAGLLPAKEERYVKKHVWVWTVIYCAVYMGEQQTRCTKLCNV
jgi:hypothetical protein